MKGGKSESSSAGYKGDGYNCSGEVKCVARGNGWKGSNRAVQIWDGRDVKADGKSVSEGVGNRQGVEVAEEGMPIQVFCAQGGVAMFLANYAGTLSDRKKGLPR